MIQFKGGKMLAGGDPSWLPPSTVLPYPLKGGGPSWGVNVMNWPPTLDDTNCSDTSALNCAEVLKDQRPRCCSNGNISTATREHFR